MTDCYYEVHQVLQRVADYYNKVRQVLQEMTDYYEVGQVLQSVTVITK